MTIEVIDVEDVTKLPTLFVAFPDLPVEIVEQRMNKLIEKLFARGREVPLPLKIYRYHTTRTTHVKGTVTVVKSPYTMLAVELKEKTR